MLFTWDTASLWIWIGSPLIYIADDVNASFFEPSIIASENLLIPTMCLYEVFKRVLREFGEERALETMGIMSLGTIIDLDRQIAIHAAQISSELKLAMADSIILATARAYDALASLRSSLRLWVLTPA